MRIEDKYSSMYEHMSRTCSVSVRSVCSAIASISSGFMSSLEARFRLTGTSAWNRCLKRAYSASCTLDSTRQSAQDSSAPQLTAAPR